MKKKISLFLCIIITITALTGCGMEQSETTAQSEGEKYDEFITIDVFDTQANYQGIQSGWFGKIVKERFNMELNIIAPNVAGGGETLFQTRSAAGNLGDLIISRTSEGRIENMVKVGLLMDMTELLKEKDVFDNYGEVIKAMNEKFCLDGIYALPSDISNQSPETSGDGIDPAVAPYVRWDAYTAAGLPEMERFEDWLSVMAKMQESVPESDSGKKTYAISLFKDWDGKMMANVSHLASMFGYSGVGFTFQKGDGSDIQDLMSDDGIYLRVLKFLFDANQAGLVDPESTTQNYDILSNKYRDGQILTSLWSWQGQAFYNTEERTKEGKGFMPAFIGDMMPVTNGCYSEGNAEVIIAIGSQAKDPERIADFIDWLYSPEGMEIACQASEAAGPEGLTWEMVDGKAVYTDFGKQALPANDVEVPQEWGGGSWKDGMCALNFRPLAMVDIDPNNNEPYKATMWSSVLEEKNTALDIQWREYSEGAFTTIEWLQENNALSVCPGTSYVIPADSSDISILKEQCGTIIQDGSWQMVFAKDEEEFKSIWENMKNTVNGLGYADVLEVDMKNAKDYSAAKIQAVEAYNSRNK